jgi:hypothetical protein
VTPETATVGMTEDVEGLFARIDQMVTNTWQGVGQSEFWRHVMTHGLDAALYRDLMVQVFHYTRFNSINQALTVLKSVPEDRGVLRFVYRHADEELGHEMMVVHDLKAVGLIQRDDDLVTFPRVPATDALINYLAGLAWTEGPVARLGYSYWAEDVYEHLAPLLLAARSSLGLTDRQMTFFVAHSDIDSEHAAEVRRAITKFASTSEQTESIYRVAETTLWLTTEIMRQTFECWKAKAVHGD